MWSARVKFPRRPRPWSCPWKTLSRSWPSCRSCSRQIVVIRTRSDWSPDCVDTSTQLLASWPLRPMHHTLGISGFEVEFTHPDQLFWVLAISCPYLEPTERDAVQRFLDELLRELPPYALPGFDPNMWTCSRIVSRARTTEKPAAGRREECVGSLCMLGILPLCRSCEPTS